MTTPTRVRIDAWVWAVRLIKTRSQAAAACKAGHIKINGEPAKPSQPVVPGDRIRIWHNHREITVEVTQLVAKRVGAPVAKQCYIDHTPPPPAPGMMMRVGVRDRGAGRPTKKDRRDIERLRKRGAGSPQI